VYIIIVARTSLVIPYTLLYCIYINLFTLHRYTLYVIHQRDNLTRVAFRTRWKKLYHVRIRLLSPIIF